MNKILKRFRRGDLILQVEILSKENDILKQEKQHLKNVIRELVRESGRKK